MTARTTTTGITRRKPGRQRRNKGEGSANPRPDGKWRGYVTIDGKRIWRSVYATRAEVLAENRETLKNHEDGLPVTGKSQTLTQYAASWLNIKKTQLDPATHERYEQLFKFHILPTLGKIPLPKLTAQQVGTMMADRLKAGAAPRTVHHVHSVLHNALQDAMRHDLVGRNVAALVDAPRVPKKEARSFTEAECAAILTASRGTRWHALYYLGLTAGPRLGELLGLKWSDIDFREMTVKISRSEQAARSRPAQEKRTKTERSRRPIQLDETLIAVLREHKRAQNAERLAMGTRWQDRDLVFCTTIGTPINGSNLRSRHFYPLLASVGIERQGRDLGTTKVVMHTMRHNAASHALASGEHSIAEVSAMLGHTQASTTLNIYSHVIPGNKTSVSGSLRA